MTINTATLYNHDTIDVRWGAVYQVWCDHVDRVLIKETTRKFSPPSPSDPILNPLTGRPLPLPTYPSAATMVL